MFESETSQVVLKRMLDSMPSDLDKREGSVVSDLASPSANEMANLYALLDTVMKLAFASTSSGEWLELRCAELGIFRKMGTFAEGYVTFNGDDVLDEGRLILKGTSVSTGGETPLYFFTTEDVLMQGGLATVRVLCEITGSYGNLRSGDIKNVVGDLSSILTVTNEFDFYSGSDDETDSSLYDRYVEFVSKPVTSGNENHYLTWAKSVAGIGDARVRSIQSDATMLPGQVDVVLLDAQKLSASASLQQSVADYIESVRPVGATVTVRGANALTLDITATIVLRDGYTLDLVENTIHTNIANYITGLAFKDDTVRFSQIANCILDVNGVLDYGNLTVNGGTGNIATAYDEVAVVGTVSLT